jgi:autotransporter-associated beta strand protein
VIMRGNSFMVIFLIDGPSLTIGSLEGEGTVLCETKGLIVGKNNTDTTFAGSIFGTGSLTKIGSGTLVLAKPSFYSGGTIVQRGRLLVNNNNGSATGTGPVQVNRAGFGGNGIAAGAVTIGDGSGAGAALSPGIDGAGLLTIQNSLTFKANSRYNWNVEATAVKADETVAQGVTIEIGALFQIFGRGSVPLPIGTIFTAISNTAATPIAGTFSNLADGATITAGNNTFQANYSGGDGNDLTLTVVP